MWTIFKDCIEFVPILLLFYVLVFWPGGMWDLPRPGLEPVSPALAGRFSTTAPPGKPQRVLKNAFFQKYFEKTHW